MYANYHTHTARCHHAKGTEREYIEAAIKAGYRVLGFADHVPHIVSDKDYDYRSRMKPEQTYEYVSNLIKLRDEYVNDIKIHIGFEMEYYPSYFEETLRFLGNFEYEYLILGQHHIEDGEDGEHVMNRENTDEQLRAYADRVVDGINTGKFSCVAHPDVVHYVGDGDFYKEQMKRICRAAKEQGVPVEINCMGVMKNRCYPDDRFWRIASDMGNSVIIGVDAHSPAELLDKSNVAKCQEISRRFELFPIRELKFKNPKL
jgi:histidinol-phosphatase (PHP family)